MSSTFDDDPTRAPLRARGLSASNTLPLGTRLGEFEIIGLVGEGGFGIVYLAHDHVLDRDVAIKEYMPTALAARTDGATVIVRSARYEEPFEAGLRSFINEAKLLARFDHPSLLKVFRFWSANGTAYMAMPYYRGITLKQLLRDRGTPPDEAWLKDLLRPVTDALELLHGDSCFHRDIAPDNILMLDGERPLLLDFGAARRVIGDLTQELTAILKPGYAPVEQYGEAASTKQGAWTDLYALASVVYFAINGRAPEPSVARLIADPVVPLAVAAKGRYSAEFLAGLDKALNVRPQDRPRTVAEFRVLIGLAERRRHPRTPIAQPGAVQAAHTVPAGSDETTIVAPGKSERPSAAASEPGPVIAPLAPLFATSDPMPPPRLHAAARSRKVSTAALAGIAGVLIAGAGFGLYRWLGSSQDNAPASTQVAPASAPVPASDEGAARTEGATQSGARASDTAPPPVVAPARPAVETTPPAAIAPPRKVARPPSTTPSTSLNARQECVDILQRVSLGEPLSATEQRKLKEDCR